MKFLLNYKGKTFAEFRLAATGHHNVLNAIAAIIVAQGLDISHRTIQEALATFRSVKRRMDVKGEVYGILAIDDFAHHPTAIRATIQAARLRWPGRRLCAVLEPRSNAMRRKVFQDALPEALALADSVILDAVHRATLLDDAHRLDPEAVAVGVRSHGKDARVLPSADDIVDLLAAEAKSGDIFLIMSNGSFDGLCEKLLKKLSARQIPSEANAR